MQELRGIWEEFQGAWTKVGNYQKKMTMVVAAQFLICMLSLAYCIVGMYHQYFKGLICLVASLAVTSMTYVTATQRVNPVGILLVDCIALFVFIHVQTRKWAYLNNDHDMINDYSY